MTARPDDLNNQVGRIINETIAAIGCSNQTALALMVIQASIRMRDREKPKELRTFIDVLTEEPEDADDD